jgi:Resolvase, N terminal domain
VDAKGQFRSLAEPWADTGTSTGRLVLAVLGGLADVERDLIRPRTAEGRGRASPRRHMGRPPSLLWTPAQQKEATRRRAQGATLQELADSYRPQHIHHAPRDACRVTYMLVAPRGLRTVTIVVTTAATAFTTTAATIQNTMWRL